MRIFFYIPESLYAILCRHHVIQEKHVIFILFGKHYTFIAIICSINTHTQLLDQALKDYEVHWIIIHHKYTGIRRNEAFFIPFLLFQVFPV